VYHITVRPCLLSLVILLAAACAPRIEPVAVEFRNLDLESFERGELELAVFNPNRVAVDVEALNYRLLLGTDTVALGARVEPVRVPAGDSVLASFPFDIRFSFDLILNRLTDYLDDTLRLDINGRYLVQGAFGPKRRPFRYRHQVPIRPEVEKLLRPFKRLFGED